ncbi:MAG: RluA family pseudouridine synthase [Saprospiraceae bacterium]
MKRISELVLYKDHHLIGLNKPSGLPTQQDKSEDPSIHRMAMAYAHSDLYVVHRIDRRVSGVIVFAKTKASAKILSDQWIAHTVKKIYYAIVTVAEIEPSGRLTHYLTYDYANNISMAHAESMPVADESILEYKVIQQLENFMVLEIHLITGRKHQIRSQLSALGIPIRGDVKYGSKRTNENGSIDLHAYSLEFLHPTTKKPLKLIAPFPEEGLWKHVQV